ncbi:sn-glycerol-3-phosphate ABC transporter ATP-binding protein UgpC [Ferrimicrobium sp.]|uniref:ABC transporter ATP-binding protein n=1 Tax=Ferrimicrobium sp. TaxID=2926050 RepID=UPI0026162741|nr:sn-glycerol-3-phosphate ABC transporter ATP-binding protein UgpC [Ferrimicrobium sp.]
MASIVLENVTKTYSNDYCAVKDLNLAVNDGEFMVLVGPSGCGKTTVLRMVAGLEDISSGNLLMGDRLVNDLEPKDRDMAMVFQSYALYPHMTVAENIGFALRMKKLPKQQVRKRVEAAAEILGLTGLLDAKPKQLSGGQRQRVAMGRAIVREPSAFLMDEPLSNLDAKLRVKMRAEVKRIQAQLGVSTIYVTHDQMEAMTMGDRVAVLRDGLLQQCDTPQNLYDNPVSQFVAAFIGSPAMNLYEASLLDGARALRLGSQVLELPESVRISRPSLVRYGGRRITVGIRPNDLRVATQSDGFTFTAQVVLLEALGAEVLVHFTVDATAAKIEGAVEDDDEILIGGGEGVARVEPDLPVHVGERLVLSPDFEHLHFFDPTTGLAVGKGPITP